MKIDVKKHRLENEKLRVKLRMVEEKTDQLLSAVPFVDLASSELEVLDEGLENAIRTLQDCRRHINDVLEWRKDFIERIREEHE